MEELVTQLAKKVQGKYFGKYRGFVADNRDPEHRGRLRLTIPSVLGDQVSAWALPCLPFGGLPDQGWLVVPERNAQLWVEFEEGNILQPIWVGTFWQKKDPIAEASKSAAPATRVFRTPSGHALRFHDEKEKERIVLRHKGGAELIIDEKGSVHITDAKGGAIVLDAATEILRIEDTHGNTITLNEQGAAVEDGDGNSIELSSSGVKIKSQKIVLEGAQVMLGGQSSEPVIKGQSFLSLFATHVHPTAGLNAPTGVPIPQGESSTLSTSVKVK